MDEQVFEPKEEEPVILMDNPKKEKKEEDVVKVSERNSDSFEEDNTAVVIKPIEEKDNSISIKEESMPKEENVVEKMEPGDNVIEEKDNVTKEKENVVEKMEPKKDESIEENTVEKKEENIEEKNDDLSVEEKVSNRVPTGIKGFDELISGGFERDSIILLVGSAGTGKTLLGMQFLYEGVTKYNEPGIFISFEEERDSLYKHALQFGWDFKKLEEDKKFMLLYFKPHQVTKILEEGGGQIRDALTEIGAKRVVIDSITAYGLLFHDEYKRREEVLNFFNLLAKWGITSVVIAEDSPEKLEDTEGSIAFISDSVISMYYHHDEEKGLRIHSLEIVKMRGTKHTNKLCAINFEKKGLVVYPDVEVF